MMNIGNLFNKIGDMIDNKKEENRIYNELLDKSLKFNNFKDMVVVNDIFSNGRCMEILNLCPNLNDGQAKVIDGLIPISETFLFIFYITQRIDNSNYFMVFTDKYIWIMNKDKYLVMNYKDLLIFDIISKSLMTQVINFNNIVIGIDTSSNNLNSVYQFITNLEYRNNFIREKTKYLCGIIPIYQRLNKINSGISIDSNKNVIFHDRKINNYGYRYQDISNYEVLEDQSVVLKKRKDDYSHNMTSVKQNCTCITLRVTLINNLVFTIPILEPTAFNSQYDHNSSIYIENYKFVKEIVDKLDSLEPRPY